MSSYIKWFYPQIEPGKSHKRPEMPLCFIRLYECSKTWDIHSANDMDRAEFWEVDMSKLDVLHLPYILTQLQVEIDVYGAGGKAQWLIDNPIEP